MRRCAPEREQICRRRFLDGSIISGSEVIHPMRGIACSPAMVISVFSKSMVARCAFGSLGSNVVSWNQISNSGGATRSIPPFAAMGEKFLGSRELQAGCANAGVHSRHHPQWRFLLFFEKKLHSKTAKSQKCPRRVCMYAAQLCDWVDVTTVIMMSTSFHRGGAGR